MENTQNLSKNAKIAKRFQKCMASLQAARTLAQGIRVHGYLLACLVTWCYATVRLCTASFHMRANILAQWTYANPERNHVARSCCSCVVHPKMPRITSFTLMLCANKVLYAMMLRHLELAQKI